MTARNGTASEDPAKHLAILDQAIRTFAELGFRGTDVQVIADRAGVGKGTVYRYFRNKEDLFWAATYEVMMRLERHLDAAMIGVEGAAPKVRASAVAYADFFETNPPYLEMFVQERAEFRGCGPESHLEFHEQMMRKFGTILQQGIENGELRPVDPRTTVLALGCLLHGTVVLGSHLRPANVMQITEQAVDIFLRGLRTESTSTDKTGTGPSRSYGAQTSDLVAARNPSPFCSVSGSETP
jgi:AcrR family transcriptional regulator